MIPVILLVALGAYLASRGVIRIGAAHGTPDGSGWNGYPRIEGQTILDVMAQPDTPSYLLVPSSPNRVSGGPVDGGLVWVTQLIWSTDEHGKWQQHSDARMGMPWKMLRADADTTTILGRCSSGPPYHYAVRLTWTPQTGWRVAREEKNW